MGLYLGAVNDEVTGVLSLIGAALAIVLTSVGILTGAQFFTAPSRARRYREEMALDNVAASSVRGRLLRQTRTEAAAIQVARRVAPLGTDAYPLALGAVFVGINGYLLPSTYLPEDGRRWQVWLFHVGTTVLLGLSMLVFGAHGLIGSARLRREIREAFMDDDASPLKQVPPEEEPGSGISGLVVFLIVLGGAIVAGSWNGGEAISSWWPTVGSLLLSVGGVAASFAWRSLKNPGAKQHRIRNDLLELLSAERSMDPIHKRHSTEAPASPGSSQVSPSGPDVHGERETGPVDD